jgi:hypothetical protein
LGTAAKVGAILFIIIILGTLYCFLTGIISFSYSQENELKPKNVNVRIEIQSNVDWEGSVSCMGEDPGQYSISSSENSKNQTLEYTAHGFYFAIKAQFQVDFMGEHFIISDGWLRTRMYINGKLENNDLTTTFSGNDGVEYTYYAGYS